MATILSVHPGNIIIESGPLASTGGKVWSASTTFFDSLVSHGVVDASKSLKYLELGSGCGWLGLRVALESPKSTVVMSERSDFGALEWLDHNVSLNPSIPVQTVELDWMDLPESVIQSSWDCVIGCELVYSYEGAVLLANVLGAILRASGAVCYYAHSLNRFETVDEKMLSEFERNGLQWEILGGGDVSPGTFDDLFPEIRVVIFKIHVNR